MAGTILPLVSCDAYDSADYGDINIVKFWIVDVQGYYFGAAATTETVLFPLKPFLILWMALVLFRVLEFDFLFVKSQCHFLSF